MSFGWFGFARRCLAVWFATPSGLMLGWIMHMGLSLSWLEHLLCKQGVRCSNPRSSTGSCGFAGFRPFRSSTHIFVYNISIGSVQGFGGLFSLGRFGVRVPGIFLDVL